MLIDNQTKKYGIDMIQKLIIEYNNTLAYADYGDPNGYPILAQHGLIASINEAELFAPLLQQGARVICTARPGYGVTSPIAMCNIGEWGDCIARLVDALELSQFDVLGMSSGAPYCYAIGSRFPHQARNLFVFSGIPAMYDDAILAHWPFEIVKGAPIREMQSLARELFFTNISEEDLRKDEIKDSMRNDCFGIGLDFHLRCLDWGFKLDDIRQKVFMRHARFDTAVPFITAKMTAELLPHCSLQVEENDIHFSPASFAQFCEKVILPNM